jgi:cytochrome b pre-mRNA-processing protein 3
MFKRLFARRSANEAIVDALYEQIVAAARQPFLYLDARAPDTPLGRYEMIALHAFLVLERLRGQPGAAADVAQELTDRFFADMEDGLRGLGIGDLGIPKRMKKLARMFFGRTLAYRAALADRDGDALADALVRNVRPGEKRDEAAERLALYVFKTEHALACQDLAAILAGRVGFIATPAEMREAASS